MAKRRIVKELSLVRVEKAIKSYIASIKRTKINLRYAGVELQEAEANYYELEEALENKKKFLKCLRQRKYKLKSL